MDMLVADREMFSSRRSYVAGIGWNTNLGQGCQWIIDFTWAITLHGYYHYTLSNFTMHDDMTTTRERITRLLRTEPATASELAAEFELPVGVVIEHVEHIAKTVDGADTDEQLLVSPPRCLQCGFDGFDTLVNVPSRCPSCKSESLAQPQFTIE